MFEYIRVKWVDFFVWIAFRVKINYIRKGKYKSKSVEINYTSLKFKSNDTLNSGIKDIHGRCLSLSTI